MNYYRHLWILTQKFGKGRTSSFKWLYKKQEEKYKQETELPLMEEI